MAFLCGAARLQAQPGTLFPEPFRVEHHAAQDDGDGTPYVGEAVRDTYGGSWLVSERPDGSRLILDFDRREVSEVRAKQGTYWTVSFDSLAALGARLQAAQGLASLAAPKDESAPGPKAQAQSAVTPEEIVVTELPGESARKSVAFGGPLADAAPLSRPGVRHLRIGLRNGPESAGVEAWVDPSLRLTPAAVAALGTFESQVSSPRRDAPPSLGSKLAAGSRAESRSAISPARALAAARAYADGALVLRTVRPLLSPAGTPQGTLEDVVTRLERLERFPSELAQIPEGLRRTAHPLEAVVRFLEADRARDAAMSGRTAPAAGDPQ